MELEKQAQQGMKAATNHLVEELKNLRTSRANSSMLDSVQVAVYGTDMRLKDVATVTVPEPRQLLITPFDSSNIHAIAKGIEAANLNLRPVVDGHIIRITIPPMDQQRREGIAKRCREMGEDAKVAVRKVRRTCNDKVRAQKSAGELPEDLMKKCEQKIQELTDKFCTEIDQLCTNKEKEILEI